RIDLQQSRTGQHLGLFGVEVRHPGIYAIAVRRGEGIRRQSLDHPPRLRRYAAHSAQQTPRPQQDDSTARYRRRRYVRPLHAGERLSGGDDDPPAADAVSLDLKYYLNSDSSDRIVTCSRLATILSAFSSAAGWEFGTARHLMS